MIRGWTLSLALHLGLLLAGGLTCRTWIITDGGSDMDCTLRAADSPIVVVERSDHLDRIDRVDDGDRGDQSDGEFPIPKWNSGMAGAWLVPMHEPYRLILVLDDGDYLCSRWWRMIREEYGDDVIVVIIRRHPPETFAMRRELLRSRHDAALRWPLPQGHCVAR